MSIGRSSRKRTGAALKSMRICFLCEGYPPAGHGGIGTFTQNLARALVRAGHQVRVLAKMSRNVAGTAYEEDEGVRVWRRPRSTQLLSRARERYDMFRTIARWSETGKIEVVEVPDCAGWIAGWPLLTVPVIVRLHGSLTYINAELGEKVGRTCYCLEWAALRRADFWCSVSHYAAVRTQQLFGLRRDQPTILYNPMNVAAQAPVRTRSNYRVVYTGGLKLNKGVLSLFKAWPQVVAANPQAELNIYGADRPMNGRSMLDFLFSGLDNRLKPSIKFLGFANRHSIFDALQTAAVAVFPSYAEAFAQAPMEAMACGCPTVYTKRTSGPELIEHERTGLLIDPDRPDEIADAITRLLSDAELARRLGEAGRKRIEEKFSIDILVRQNEAFYEHCVEEFRRGRARPR